MDTERAQRFDTVVVGGGQAGLSVGYHLARQGRSFVILDANERVGDAWRKRWDSLRLFTPGKYDGLAGMPFTGPRHAAPTKDQMADYLEAYAARFALPVHGGTEVTSLCRRNGAFLVETAAGGYEAGNVVVATGAQHAPRIPSFANELDPRIVQMHSTEYKRASQLQDGPVLIVGAGNSGADIAMDVARTHPTRLSGRHPGHVPFRIDTFKARFLVPIVRFLGYHVITIRTPVGRKLRPIMLAKGDPLVRIKPKDLAAAGVERVPRVEGIRDGLPLLADGRVVEATNVIWCTGSRLDFSWIDLPGFDGATVPDRGVAEAEPGLYFVGMPFQYAITSETITGVRRDAERVVRHIAAHRNGSAPAIAAAAR